MVKRTLCSMAIVALLAAFVAVPAGAQEKRAPVPVLSWNVIVPPSPGVYVPPTHTVPATAPSYCNPCLFYGGDFDSSLEYANGLFNGDVGNVTGTNEVLVPFHIPAGQTWDVSGLFTNNLTNFYPGSTITADWSISKGVSEGNGGTVVASGTATASYTATGRSGFGYTEYTVLVTGLYVPLTSGMYWLTVEPVSTSTDAVSYLSDNGIFGNAYGPAEPGNMSYFESAYFGYTYENTGDLGDFGLWGFSAGVLGRIGGN